MPITQFQLGHGGAELQAHRLARALIASRHEVEIVTARNAGEATAEIVEGVPVRRLFCFGNRRLVWRLGPYSYTGLLIAELLRRRSAHDVVHAHQALQAAFGAVVARRLGGRPVVVKVATAGPYGDLVQMREGRPTLPAGSAWMAQTILKGADALVAISDAIAEELRVAGVPPDRVVRIPNGVDVRPLPTPDERAAARFSVGVAPETPVVVYVGRAGEQKGSDILLRAWRAVVERGAPTGIRPRLFLLGEGFDKDVGFMRLALEIGDSLTVTGRVRDVQRYLAAADLFVLPSRGEGLSNAILEAMMSGVPCVVSDIAPNRELIGHGRTGLTFPSGDVAGLAGAMRHALEWPSEMAALAASARRLVEERYAMPEVTRAYETLYARLVGQPAPLVQRPLQSL